MLRRVVQAILTGSKDRCPPSLTLTIPKPSITLFLEVCAAMRLNSRSYVVYLASDATGGGRSIAAGGLVFVLHPRPLGGSRKQIPLKGFPKFSQ